MKTENMKLLDLQTGKYLELGKDWHYCGNRIYLVGRLKECITSFNEFLRSQMKILDKYKEIDGQGNISYELAFKIATSDDECLNNAVDPQVDSGYVEKSEPQGILKTLCEKTGAVVYGGRYVLLRVVFDDYTIGDLYTHGKDDEYTGIFCMLTKLGECIQTDDSRCDGVYKHIIGNAFNVHIPSVDPIYIDGVALNIFKEYSKQLRNEENKFEELMEKLK